MTEPNPEVLPAASRPPDAPWLVIGLGNPGPEYAETYHNVGFRVVRLLAERRGVAVKLPMGPARIARWRNAAEVVLVEPQTYMNRSGSVIPVLLERFGGNARLMVLSDDLALPVGRLRIRERGSAGGHNGLKSISSVYGSDEYVRLRVGIGSGGADESVRNVTRGDTRDFVLSRVRKADRDLLDRAERLAADAVEHIVAEGVPSAMAKFNGLDLRADPREGSRREALES